MSESSLSSEISAVTVLPAPSNTSLDTSVQNEITISWTDNSDNENGFRIYRSTDGTNFSQIADVSANTTSHTDTGLSDGTTYYYYVEVYTEHTASSGSTVSGSTIGSPSQPQNLTSSVSEDDITLDWDAVDWNGDAGHYNVYRAQASGTSTADYTDIADVTSGTTTYTDSALEDGEQYYYRVDAENSAGSSDLSNETNETTDLPAPTIDSLDSVTEDEITINWTKNDDSSDGVFDIHRSQDGSLGTKIADALSTTTTSYTDSGLSDGTKYYYTLRRLTDHTSTDSGQKDTFTDKLIQTLIGNTDFSKTRGDKKKFINSVTSTVEQSPFLAQKPVAETIGTLFQIRRNVTSFHNEIFSSVAVTGFRIRSFLGILVGGIDDELSNAPIILRTENIGLEDAFRSIVSKPITATVSVQDFRNTFLSKIHYENVTVEEKRDFGVLKTQKEVVSLAYEELRTRTRKVVLEVVSRLQKK